MGKVPRKQKCEEFLKAYPHITYSWTKIKILCITLLMPKKKKCY